jgi:DNA topoisomerase-1
MARKPGLSMARRLLAESARRASRLGNTPRICRNSYVHPAVIDSYLGLSLSRTLKQRADSARRAESTTLKPEEKAVLALLEEPLKEELSRSRPRHPRKHR